jgi:hypothetical protein
VGIKPSAAWLLRVMEEGENLKEILRMLLGKFKKIIFRNDFG